MSRRFCMDAGCSTRATFGSLLHDVPLWCARHKELDDVLLTKVRCSYQGCDAPRTYGSVDDGVALRCKKHKQADDRNKRILRERMRARLGV
jgi:hypothetical protein